MVRPILLHVNHVMHPGDHPIANREAMLPVHWLSATHYNSGKKRFGKRPYPVQISHLQELPILF